MAALRESPQGPRLLVVGYFNVDLEQPEGARIYEDIATDLMAAGLEDTPEHFMP